MRIDLDKPLDKAKLRQALKLTDGKAIKVVCGTDIYDIDTITSKNGTLYFHTNSKQTVDKRLDKKKKRLKTTGEKWNLDKEWEGIKNKKKLRDLYVEDIVYTSDKQQDVFYDN